SLDGFIARKDGAVDWLETSDVFEGGEKEDPDAIRDFLEAIDCYAMGSRTYETAMNFEARGCRLGLRRHADGRLDDTGTAEDPAQRGVLLGRSHPSGERAVAADLPQHLVRGWRRTLR